MRRSRLSRLIVILLCLASASTSAQRSSSGSGTRAPSPEAAKLLLALDRLQARRWYPSTPALERDSVPDRATVIEALSSPSAELRRLAVRGIGRFETPSDVPTIALFLGDTDLVVRREAANAVAQAVVHAKDDEIMPAYEALIAPRPPIAPSRQRAADEGAFEDTRLQSLARLHYARGMAQKVFDVLVGRVDLLTTRIRPILIMVRQNAGLELKPDQVQALRLMARPPDRFTPASAEALEILKLTGHADTALLVWAAGYRGMSERIPYSGSAPIRALGVQSLIADDDAMSRALENALQDPWPDVRLLAIRRVGEAVPRTHCCAPLIEALADDRELAMVKLEAIGHLDARCNEIETATRLARDLSTAADTAATTPVQGWPIRARAIETLANVDAAAALEALERAPFDVWQVRAARVRAACSLRALERVRGYATDDDPNVRAEVLRCLSQQGHPAVVDLAIKNLGSDDYQLVVTAAEILRHVDVPVQAAMFELWSAFQRMTQQARDSARFPRVAILECLEAWAMFERTPVRTYVDELRGALQDTDPFVAAAAGRVVQQLTGQKPVVAPTYRPPLQPDAVDLTKLPSVAVIVLDTGDTIQIEFLRSEAPLAIARFVKLVDTAYFKDQPFFYRVAPFIAVNGGSPDGNDFSGDARFWRDEIGSERQTAGVLGLLTHGHDTADGRWFIDLTDQPGFEYDYTLFARVTKLRLTEPWAYGADTQPPVSALVRGGRILAVRFGES